MLSAPQPLIGPRHFSVDERAVLDEVRFESGAFNRIWEVRTNDHLLSSTIVDERLMSWLLEREPDVSFELDGPWAMTVSRGTDAAVPGDLVAALDDFLEHLPRVVIAELGRGY